MKRGAAALNEIRFPSSLGRAGPSQRSYHPLPVNVLKGRRGLPDPRSRVFMAIYNHPLNPEGEGVENSINYTKGGRGHGCLEISVLHFFVRQLA
jgi:hypothetical protein